MSEPTQVDLGRLLALQSIDDDVRRLEHQLDALPEQHELDGLERQDRTLGEERDALQDQLARAEREQRQAEGEIEGLTMRRDEEQARLYDGSLTAAREIQAAQAAIASTERRRGEHEDQLLEIMEVVEDLAGKVAELDAVRGRLAEQIAAASAARDQAAQALLVRIAEARVGRDPLTAALSPELLERYEKAALRGGGTGVGVLKDNACSACRITFPMTEISEFFQGPPLTTCTQCHRLLIVPT
jgi:predicted  nucleic acid-binding Zn-ribbon protein